MKHETICDIFPIMYNTHIVQLQNIMTMQNYYIDSGVFFQFCDVTIMAIIHKEI